MRTTQLLSGQKRSKNNGFSLPLVVVAGFILAAGGFALLARSFGGLVNSIRAEQSRQAREIAEAGMAETLENLNRRFNYLLINCHQNAADECYSRIQLRATRYDQPQDGGPRGYASGRTRV